MKIKSKLVALPDNPASFSRRIVFAVTGLSPQVVTETVFALAVKGEPRFVPTEVHILTTEEGAERARLTLLSEKPGWFQKLRSDYDLPPIEFSNDTIHALRSRKRVPINDIRTSEENERLADEITELVKGFTADDSCALHVSIAGGRKTMGFYAGYALSLFARPQDRLSHVLVAEPFEGNAEFFYPSPASSVIYTREGRPIDAAEAVVTLAEIPFVRLRQGLDKRLLSGRVRFSEAVAGAQRSLEPPSMEIDFDNKKVVLAGEAVRMQPTQLAFVSWLARRAKLGRPYVERPADSNPDVEYAREFLEEYANLRDAEQSRAATRLRKGMDRTFFDETKSRFQKALLQAVGPEGARVYGIRHEGARTKRYCVGIEATRICWAGEFPKLAKKRTGREGRP